jgi:WXG100 family type VII secretion target
VSGYPPEWAEVEQKAAQVEKFNPGAIHEVSRQFKDASANAGDHTAAMNNATAALQGGVWDGAAADAFFDYVRRVGAAGNKVKDRLDEVAGELDRLQQDLENIKNQIKSLRDGAKEEIDKRNADAQGKAATARQQMAAFKDGKVDKPPSPTEAEVLDAAAKANSQTATTAKSRIDPLVEQSRTALNNAMELCKKDLPDGFASVPPPGQAPTAPAGSPGIHTGGGGSGGGGHHGGGSGGGGGGGGLGPSGGPPATQPPGNVDQWIREAIKILQANGIPVTDADISKIWTIIEKESGGNPHAINNWDSNAAAGHPSKGLMQCIDSTFNAHKMAGHDDIYNPVDNIIAGVRYTFDRYGGFAGHPGLKSMAGGGGYQGY